MTIKDAQVKDGELCRKEFEARAEGGYSDTSRHESGEYNNRDTRQAWRGWCWQWQASRQPLLSQLAIAREALGAVVSELNYDPSNWPLIKDGVMEALKSLLLDNPPRYQHTQPDDPLFDGAEEYQLYLAHQEEDLITKLKAMVRKAHECIASRMSGIDELAECDQAYMVQTEAEIRKFIVSLDNPVVEGE